MISARIFPKGSIEPCLFSQWKLCHWWTDNLMSIFYHACLANYLTVGEGESKHTTGSIQTKNEALRTTVNQKKIHPFSIYMLTFFSIFITNHGFPVIQACIFFFFFLLFFWKGRNPTLEEKKQHTNIRNSRWPFLWHMDCWHLQVCYHNYNKLSPYSLSRKMLHT